MKQFLNWIILLGISSALLVGCKATSPEKPQSKTVAPFNSIFKATEPPAENAEDSDEPDCEENQEIPSTGNAQSLAHFAAGISHALNDENDTSLSEFYQSAISDPTNEPIVIEVSRTLISKKQPEKALGLLLRSSARPDSSSMIWCCLAQAQMQSGQTNQAVASARKAIKKDPDLLETYQTLFSIQLQSGDYPGSLKTLNKASRNVEKSPLALLGLAQLYSEYLRAQPHANPAIRTRAVALVDRVSADKMPEKLAVPVARAYEQLDQPAKAAAILKIAVEAEPSPARREKLAGLYLASGDKKRAAEQLQAIVHDNPARFPQAWFMLGRLACEVKEFAGAVGFFQKAILLDPDMEQAYYDLALAQIDLKRNGEALDTLEVARKRFPNTFVGEYFTGVAYSRLKDWAEAVRHLTKAEVIAKAGNSKDLDCQFYFQLGAAAERNHQISQAVEYFETSLKLKPDFVDSMNYLGYMLAERGENLSRAHELIDKAVQAQPTNAAYLDSLGWVLFKQGKTAEALPWLLKARDLAREPDATLYEHLGDVYQALGQNDKALEAWQKSLTIESNEEVRKKLYRLQGTLP